jgi:hypothetical protein
MVVCSLWFVHCGSFDHPDLHSLIDYKFFFFCFTIAILKFPVHVMHCWKVVSRSFQRYIKSPKIPKTSVGKPKKQICNRVTSADQGGQKNRNGQTIAVFFFTMFFY